jgi:hypothetical protein
MSTRGKRHDSDCGRFSGTTDAVVALDASGNGTKVVRHFKTVVLDQSAFITRTNDASFSFVSFSGTETNAVIQFEANGEHVAMFALGHDRNGDGLLLSTEGEIGPAFGVYGRNFRIQEASLGTNYDDGFNQGAGMPAAATTGIGSNCGWI